MKKEEVMYRTAICCCGQSEIKVEGEPKIHLVCNCNDCKKRTGSAFGMSAYFFDSQIKSRSRNTNIYEIINDETEQKRYFCSSCGTTLYWKFFKFPKMPVSMSEMTGIAGGCFSEAPLLEPTLSVENENKCAWLDLPGLNVIS